MDIFFPAYYHSFRCIAADCPDSCCKEWTVDVDPDSAAYYRMLPGALGDQLRSVLHDTEDGTTMTIEHGRCPMWQQDGLCRIQAELGHDALCKTCRDYPRLQHDYGDFIELGLELSCPEAARLILTAPAHIQHQTVDSGSEPEYDRETMQILLESRQQALALLGDDRFSPQEALAIILLYAYAVQDQIDGGDSAVLNPVVMLSKAEGYASAGNVAAILAFARDLEILTDQWRFKLTQSPQTPQWVTTSALARYLICRYWLQAISDFDLVCRAKFIVFCCILVSALGDEPMRTAQLFSKEIENNLENVEAILDGAYTSPALTDSNFFSILLGKTS